MSEPKKVGQLLNRRSVPCNPDYHGPYPTREWEGPPLRRGEKVRDAAGWLCVVIEVRHSDYGVSATVLSEDGGEYTCWAKGMFMRVTT